MQPRQSRLAGLHRCSFELHGLVRQNDLAIFPAAGNCNVVFNYYAICSLHNRGSLRKAFDQEFPDEIPLCAQVSPVGIASAIASVLVVSPVLSLVLWVDGLVDVVEAGVLAEVIPTPLLSVPFSGQTTLFLDNLFQAVFMLFRNLSTPANSGNNEQIPRTMAIIYDFLRLKFCEKFDELVDCDEIAVVFAFAFGAGVESTFTGTCIGQVLVSLTDLD
ncbi:hypothetical protein BJ878DRAFT_572737 [Calycina marina]|uniref:Uncharacterized protein n=1 Tax=Calycina marina TaxID=1763456 RepID=A0A9P8CJY0_9HELO|nr:hypothetical protein BJ878DRAFT_572737 [Calycina marina]